MTRGVTNYSQARRRRDPSKRFQRNVHTFDDIFTAFSLRSPWTVCGANNQNNDNNGITVRVQSNYFIASPTIDGYCCYGRDSIPW